jgi:MFS family permease
MERSAGVGLMSTISHAAEPRAVIAPFRSIVVLGLAAFDFSLEASIVLPALPALQRHYGASLIEIGWFATAFALVGVAAVPLLGRLGDLVGKRRVLLLALLTFATGSLLCAMTSSIGAAIAGRAIQGVGAAAPPLGLAIARDTLPRERLPQAIGLLVSVGTLGGALGFLVSGVLVDQFSSAAIFWVLFVFAVLVFVATLAWVQESPARVAGYVDVAGALLVSAGLLALLLVISKGSDWGWSSGRIVGLFIAAAVLLALFTAVEGHVPKPLIDLTLVTRRPLASANLCMLLFGFAFFLGAYVIPQIAASPRGSGYGLALSTTEIGLLLMPTCLACAAGGWMAGRLLDRVGPRGLVLAGSAVGLATFLFLALEHDNVAALATGNAGAGFSWGLILTGLYALVMLSVGPDTSGVAAAVNGTMRSTGTAIGAQAAFALIAAAGVVGSVSADAGFTRAFLMGAIGAAATLVAGAFLPGRARSASARALTESAAAEQVAVPARPGRPPVPRPQGRTAA